MKKIVLNLGWIGFIVACTPAVNHEAQQALNNYTHFVDSIYTANETWKTITDTDLVEMPIDPNDPTMTRVDTIVTLPENKEKSLAVTNYWGMVIAEQYTPLQAAVETHLEKMDDKMKKEYEASKLKYEGMLAAE